MADLPTPLPPPVAELIARRFRALADPTRVRLVAELRSGERSVGELHEAIGGSQQNVSKHLGLLRADGVVRRRREKGYSLYSVADPGVLELCEHVCGGIERAHAEIGELLASGGVGGAR